MSDPLPIEVSLTGDLTLHIYLPVRRGSRYLLEFFWKDQRFTQTYLSKQEFDALPEGLTRARALMLLL
jgi:hypothetical protein